jgi:lipopolysaccharide/colanic/teichoic acid biosynthesis glycosyltransferase
MQQHNVNSLRIRIVGCRESAFAGGLFDELSQYTEFTECESQAALEEYLMKQSLLSLPEVLMLEISDNSKCFEVVEKLHQNVMLKGLIIILFSERYEREWMEKAKRLRVHDYYVAPFTASDIYDRISFLVKFKLIKPTLSDLSKEDIRVTKFSPAKRLFDIVFSLTMLILLSPILLLTALIIKLESRGPAIYKSKRVGTGFKIFDFYKFRSMYSDADKRLAEFAQYNQYSGDGNSQSTFVKLKNDPRITKIGRIIRKTSIDELPQLFNILKGDMSMVGNRPLPLYEAERLTSDEWSWRFLAPAGLTGLWQVSRRGKEEMSERERKKLDNFYAKKYSLMFDMKILVRTIPAVFQKSDV